MGLGSSRPKLILLPRSLSYETNMTDSPYFYFSLGEEGGDRTFIVKGKGVDGKGKTTNKGGLRVVMDYDVTESLGPVLSLLEKSGHSQLTKY